jgi:hypothetical protein
LNSAEKDKANFSLFLLLFWLTIPFLIAYFISVAFLPVLTERNLIISLPAAFLVFSHAILRLPFNLFLKKLFFILLFLILLFHLTVKKKYYNEPEKAQFKAVVQYVLEKEDNADPLIVGFCWSEYMFNYYFKRMDSEIAVDALLGGENDIEPLQNLIEENEPDYFWYIFAHRSPDEQFLKFLNKTYFMKEEKSFAGAGVFLYKVN